jgi:hypothetical protein
MEIRLGFFIIWHVVVYAIGFFVSWVVPDEPIAVRIAKAKARYLERVAIDPNFEVQDETEEHMHSEIQGTVHNGELLESKFLGRLNAKQKQLLSVETQQTSQSTKKPPGRNQEQPSMVQMPTQSYIQQQGDVMYNQTRVTSYSANDEMMEDQHMAPPIYNQPSQPSRRNNKNAYYDGRSQNSGP